MAQNHYQVLGVPANAALAEIKRAYRRLVVQYHPDKHGGDPRFEEQFKAVSAAYRVLGDAGRRATYDFQLAQAQRRAEEERRRQQYRPAGQHVYGVPMPPPAPLRTRRPAGTRERHYQPIAPKQKVRFTRQDYLLVALISALMALFGTVLVLSLNHWAGQTNYRNGQQAFLRDEWSRAASFADQALSFRPEFAPALRLRGELEQLVYQHPDAALTDYASALQSERDPALVARLHYRIGRCQMTLHLPAEAESSFSQALKIDSTLDRAYLARAENRLLELHQVPAALRDFDHGLRLRRAVIGAVLPWRHVQLRGLALTHLGRLEEARRDYAAVLAAWPASGRTNYLLGCLAQRECNDAAACEFFRRAVELGYDYAQPAYANCQP